MTVALVTGAGRGIGAAVAARLAERSFVVVADRDREAAERTAAAVGGEAAHVDVTDGEAVASLVDGIVERHGSLDHACNSAGVTGIESPLEDYPARVFHRVLDVNTGLACLQAELRVMGAAGVGSIVNVASGAGALGVPRHAAYVASKHALLGLTRTAAIEYASRNVRVNAVAPGWVGTTAVQGMDADAFVAAHPIGRAIEPSEVADVVAWLLLDAPAALTGALVPVDGGLSARVAGLS